MNALTAPPWTPPLDTPELDDVLEKLRQWTPYDGDALLDNVGAVLDDVVPRDDELEDLAKSLRGHLMRLVDIAVAQEAHRDRETDRLIRQARDIRAQEMPGDHMKAVGHLRRMGWSVNELMERLVITGCLKEAA